MKLIRKSIHAFLAVTFLAFGLLLTAAPFGEEGSSFIPFTFVPGTTAKAAEVNANFSAVGDAVQSLQAGAWTPSGGSIYWTSGNVGIGTSAPLANLHVDGSVRFANGTVRLESLAQNNTHPLVVTMDTNGNLAYRDYPSTSGGGVTSVMGSDGLYHSGTTNVALGILDNGVSTSKLANDSVTTTKLANSSVTGQKISQMGAVLNDVLTWTGSMWQPQAVSIQESDPTWSGQADLDGAIGRVGNVSIGTTLGSNTRLQIDTGNNPGLNIRNNSSGQTGLRVTSEASAGRPLFVINEGANGATFTTSGNASNAVSMGNTGSGHSLRVINSNGGRGLYVVNSGGGEAGYFAGSSANVVVEGNLDVGGSISKGGGSFKIDHPLDPKASIFITRSSSRRT